MKNRTPSIAALIISALLFFPSAGAWGRLGHRVSTRIAWDELYEKPRAVILKILGPEPWIDTATWADEHREFPGTALWHCVDVPITAPGYDPQYCPPSGCVVSKIEDFRRILSDPKTEMADKRIALNLLVYLTEDLHQPLHVGDNNDNGGNLLRLRFFGVGTNLHRIWDSQVIERYSADEEQWYQELRPRINGPGFDLRTDRKSVVDWANESLEIAKLAYRMPGGHGKLLKPGTALDQDYYRFALRIIRQQLARAGFRVAWILNEVFK